MRVQEAIQILIPSFKSSIDLKELVIDVVGALNIMEETVHCL